jgi:MFS family permease
MYGFMKSSGDLGPGNMIGLVSTESYATPVPGICYSISAAAGKLGAVIGTQVFLQIRDHLGQRWTFGFAAICGLLCVIVVYFLIADLKNEDLKAEDNRFVFILLG